MSTLKTYYHLLDEHQFPLGEPNVPYIFRGVLNKCEKCGGTWIGPASRFHSVCPEKQASTEELKQEISRMRIRIERLRGGLKWCSGRFLDWEDMEASEQAMKMAGDMEIIP